MFSPRTTRLTASIILICFFSITIIGGILIFSNKARAQVGGPTTETGLGYWSIKDLKMSFGQSLMVSGLQALMNAITLFTQQFAYDFAVGLASGFKGEKPFFFLENWEDYFTQNALDAAGEFIGTLNEDWSLLGLDLCAPRLPYIQLSIQLGLAEMGRPKPKCEFAEIAKNWTALSREITNPSELLKHVQVSFKPGESDLSQAMRAYEAMEEKIAEKKKAAEETRNEGSGVRWGEGYLSGQIQTPAVYTQEKFQQIALGGSPEAIDKKTKDVKTDALISATIGGDAWLALINTLMGTFTNTLASRLLKMGMEGLVQLTQPKETIDLKSLIAAPSGGAYREAAQARFADLITPVSQITSYDILSELSSCPTSGVLSPYQCALDEKFAQAVREGQKGTPLTVKQAVEKGFLDKNKIFGFRDNTTDPPLEPELQSGYPYSGMKKLRLARVLPIGWELAAIGIQEKGDGKTYTLGQMIDAFGDNGTDGKCGTEDAGESDFCGMVDPSWLLKPPMTQCKQKAFGAMTDNSGNRLEVCADFEHCLIEDEKGGCKAWGYCAREKNIWRFQGDPCSAQYASCETYKRIGKPPAGALTELSLLENTLDFGACNADNAGCRAYFSWAKNPEMTDWDVGKRVYLDGDAEKCKASDDGCFELVRAPRDNLLLNPSFEKDENGDNMPDFWLNDLGAVVLASDAFVGSKSVQLSGSPWGRIFSAAPAASYTSYTLSFYAKSATNKAVRAGIKLAKGVTPVPDTGSNNQIGEGWNWDSVNKVFYKDVSISNTWTRYVFNFTTLPDIDSVAVYLASADALIDAVQLEQGTTATEYREGYGANPRITYLKKPPAWLVCDGEEGEPAQCANYARICRQEEVGCERFAPVTGDPAIAGIATEIDRCPSECVGYAAYKQEKTNFEPAIFPEYLIPSQAQTCDIQNVGCSEFTNLTTEAREYFSFLRTCQRPTAGTLDDTDGTYYTWEGVEATGYQLRTWGLKRSTVSYASPATTTGSCVIPQGATVGKCNNATSPDATCATNRDCRFNEITTASQTAPAAPPCTNVDALSDPPNCVDIPANQAICAAADIGVNPDCRAFYDAAGNIFYRLYSRTVLVTPECNKYRITGAGRALNQSECEKAGGDWNTSCYYTIGSVIERPENLDHLFCLASRGSWDKNRKQCLYSGYPAESSSCPESANSCRLFTGNTGANIRTIAGPDDFEDGSIGWSGGINDVKVVAEATSIGGHSLRVSSATASRPLSVLERGESYIISLWAKSAIGQPNIEIQARLKEKSDLGSKIDSSRVKLQPDWQAYSFGPLKIEFDVKEPGDNQGPALDLIITNGTAYLDNIIVRQVKDQLPLLKSSIRVPLSCDSLPPAMGGGFYPQAMLGCQEYKDRAQNTHYLKSFSSFCRDRSVGCEEFADTFNSSEISPAQWNTQNSGVCRGETIKTGSPPQGQNTKCCLKPETGQYQYTTDSCGSGFVYLCTIGADKTSCSYGPDVSTTTSNLGIDDSTVPRDQRLYLVFDEKKQCKKEARGCQGLGYKDVSGAWAVEYLKNEPDNYNRILCKYEEEGCSAWGSGAGASYFKDPSVLLCQWRENVDIGGAPYSGWFKKGKDEPCYGSVTGGVLETGATYLIAGQTFGVWRNYDVLYRGLAGECPRQQAGCTEFLDPTDQAPEYAQGKPYYYLDNAKLDRASCQGKVSREEGCILFNQTDLPEKNWSATASYRNSDNKNGSLVSPINCDKTPWECTWTKQETIGGQTITIPVSVSNNSNAILKVKRDRECAEWLGCRSWMTDVTDKTLCTFYGRCSVLGAGFADAQAPECQEWILPNNYKSVVKEPTAKRYQDAREDAVTNWAFRDLSGYTLPYTRPVDQLRELTASYSDGVKCVLETGLCQGKPEVEGRTCQSDSDCKTPVRLGYFEQATLTDSPYLKSLPGSPSLCAKDADCFKGFVCEQGECVLPKVCRGYPAANSPLPRASYLVGQGQAQGCAEGNCDCSYLAHQAGGATAYYPFGKAVSLVCSQGTDGRIGKTCQNDSDCAPSLPDDQRRGYCSPISSTKQFIGWRGYCLEYDSQRSMAGTGQAGGESISQCLTWAPVAVPQGEFTAFSQAPSAEFRVAAGREYYCYEPYSAPFTAGEVTEDENDYFGLPQDRQGQTIALAECHEGCDCGDQEEGRFCRYPGLVSQYKSRLLGCYEIADGQSMISGSNYLFYPYKGNPIYQDQLYNIKIESNGKLSCSDESGVSQLGRGSTGGNTFDLDAKKDWSETFNSSGGSLTLSAVFERDGLFKGIAIQAYDQKDEGEFFISYLSFSFKQGCERFVKVTNEDGKAKVFTDRITRGTPPLPERIQASPLAVSKDNPCEPWGAIGYNRSKGDPSYTYITVPQKDAEGNYSCRERQGQIYKHGDIGDWSKGLFARLYTQYNFNEGLDNLYYGPSGTPIIDITEQVGNPPNISQFKVNGKEIGEVKFNSSVAPVTLTFFGSPDKNQMPIRRIAVDWDDGTPPSIVGDGKTSSFKARHPRCDNTDFSKSPEACDDKPFTFSHVYFCSSDVSGWQASTNSCVFKPKVQILDNWGWCNGDCPGAPGGNGCYDAQDSPASSGYPTDECKTDKQWSQGQGPWTDFAGYVIVVPQ